MNPHLSQNLKKKVGNRSNWSKRANRPGLLGNKPRLGHLGNLGLGATGFGGLVAVFGYLLPLRYGRYAVTVTLRCLKIPMGVT